MKKKLNRLDREIARRVQAVESDIPPHLERAFMDAMDHMDRPVGGLTTDQPPRWKRRPFYYGALAAAATLLLVTLIVFFYLFYQQGDPSPACVAEAVEVVVQDTFVEDRPATTYVMNPKDPDMTIVWVEKINNEQ